MALPKIASGRELFEKALGAYVILDRCYFFTSTMAKSGSPGRALHHRGLLIAGKLRDPLHHAGVEARRGDEAVTEKIGLAKLDLRACLEARLRGPSPFPPSEGGDDCSATEAQANRHQALPIAQQRNTLYRPLYHHCGSHAAHCNLTWRGRRMNVHASEMRRFDLLFEELTDQALAGIAERLKYQRVTHLMQAWQKCRERKARFDPLSAAVAFFSGLEAIAQRAENGVLEFINRWPVGYFASRNYQDSAKEELAYGRLAIDLLYSTLPDGTSPLAGLTFAIPLERDGSLLALGAGGRLFLRGLTGSTGALTWSCSARTATITDLSNLQSSMEIELPLSPADMPLAAFRPNAVASGFQMPILGDGANVLLTSGYSPDHKDPRPPNKTVTEKPFTLVDSLHMAHDVLAAVWPDVIPWARALVPAVADMGGRAPGVPRLSGSFSPGQPIYLTQVSDPLFHAEDLIHEVQHLRFAITVPAEEWFGNWHEQREVFISPYRPDLRPITGIHVGLHAFVAVTEFGLRTINQSALDQVPLSQLYDTHLRNLFAFHTIANHEKLSSEGKSYYRKLGCILTDQDRRVKAMVKPAQREQILSSLRWPIRPASEGEAAANVSLDIRHIASTDGIAGLIPA